MSNDAPRALDLLASPWTASVPELRKRLEENGFVEAWIDDPDLGPSIERGAPVDGDRRHLGWRDWLDLGEALGAKVRIPVSPSTVRPGQRLIVFERLGPESEVHDPAATDRYAVSGSFARVRKTALPGFRLPLLEAIGFATSSREEAEPPRTLVLGCHSGDELEALVGSPAAVPPDRVVGVDREPDALSEARRRFPTAIFVEADVTELAERPLADRAGSDLGRFDLIVAIALLQSPSLDGPAVLRGLVRHHASEHGGLVVGLPASRFRDGEIVWGARTRNYAETDLSLVVRDLAGHRRYLHQHGYRTRIGGRYDLLLAAHR